MSTDAQELEDDGQVAIFYNKYLYVIHWSDMNDGWYVDKFDPFDLEDGPIDGGLCTGSAQDAVEFLL